MSATQSPKGPWINRFATRLFTLVLAVLIFWLLGFSMQDIKSIRGPDYSAIEKQHVDQSLVKRSQGLKKQVADLSRKITNGEEERNVVGDSWRNLERIISQLVELQTLSIQKDLILADSPQANLTLSINQFVESQKRYQELNRNLAQLVVAKQGLEDEKRGVDERLEQQRKPAREEYNRLRNKHRRKLAGLQLLILIPLLLVGALLFVKKRDSIYFPLFLAFGGATVLKTGLVVHEYFPARYFKYILIIVLLLAVARLLIHFIRTVAFPKTQWLLKQYREAYEHFLCPVCEYPIRIGPLRFLYWTRRTIKKVTTQKLPAGEEESYTCPSCGTALFEQCSSCQKVRHSLLPHCRKCGVAKDIGEGAE